MRLAPQGLWGLLTDAWAPEEENERSAAAGQPGVALVGGPAGLSTRCRSTCTALRSSPIGPNGAANHAVETISGFIPPDKHHRRSTWLDNHGPARRIVPGALGLGARFRSSRPFFARFPSGNVICGSSRAEPPTP